MPSLGEFGLILLAVAFFGWFGFGLLGSKCERGPWRRISSFFGWTLVSLLVLVAIFFVAWVLFPESVE